MIYVILNKHSNKENITCLWYVFLQIKLRFYSRLFSHSWCNAKMELVARCIAGMSTTLTTTFACLGAMMGTNNTDIVSTKSTANSVRSHGGAWSEWESGRCTCVVMSASLHVFLGLRKKKTLRMWIARCSDMKFIMWKAVPNLHDSL
jgi:hypothetical protein